jgi:hypothetical protein
MYENLELLVAAVYVALVKPCCTECVEQSCSVLELTCQCWVVHRVSTVHRWPWAVLWARPAPLLELMPLARSTHCALSLA